MTVNGKGPVPELPAGYEPFALLSRGNSFDVYDAWSLERGCRVIVKTPRDELSRDQSSVRRLMREGGLLARLTHPHIVRSYETRNDGSRPIVVMETLGGQTLAHMIEFDGTLSDEDAAQLGLQVGSALRYLHTHGRLHLDLKPSNVIAEARRAKLIDLGLASPPGQVNPGLGTWCYLAPEQARGGPVGSPADVWGLGALLFEALAGWPPFDDPEREVDGVADEELEFPQLERRARPLVELSSAGEELAGLVDSCLRHEAAQRPPLLTVLGALERIGRLPVAERRWAS